MKTKTLLWAVVMGFWVFLAGAMNTWAEGGDRPGASANIAVFSKYVWRGYELSKDSAVIQPALAISYRGAGFSLWGNLDTDVYGDTRNESSFNETDMTLSYDKNFGMVSMGVGYIYYALDAVDDSQEMYIRVGLDTLLSPSLAVYREIAHLPSWYVSIGISHSFELMKDITLDMAGSTGYYYSDDDDFVEIDDNLNTTSSKYQSFHNGLVSVGLTISVVECVTVTPMIAYSFPLTNEADNLIKSTSLSNESDYVYGGVTLTMAF